MNQDGMQFQSSRQQENITETAHLLITGEDDEA